ncbi:MAG: acylneuraminate cytidylyltransferase family protein [Myxococcota bacterium]
MSDVRTLTKAPDDGAVLAVIPARGGSQGVPRKNLREVAGRSLVARALDAAAEATSVGHVVLSTEDSEIAAHGRSLGLEVVPRPAELADSTAPLEPTLLHASRAMQARFPHRWVVLLQPTSPFRRAADIDACVAAVRRTGATSGLSVVDAEITPAYLHHIEAGRLERLYPEFPKGYRRQDFPPLYVPNGAVYVGHVDLLAEGVLIGPSPAPVVMSTARSFDLDSEEDFARAGWALDRDPSLADSNAPRGDDEQPRSLADWVPRLHPSETKDDAAA